jgi:hypothetical protein
MRMTTWVSALSFALVSCAGSPQKPSPNLDDNGLIKLRAEKNSAENHVLRAKQLLDASKQKQARRLYDEAIEQYNAYVDGLLHCIKTGPCADLTPSATEASTRAAAFKTFVDDNSTTKGPDWITTGLSLVKAALDLIADVRKGGVIARKQYAEELEPQIKWKKWSEIVQ